jgi:hypothetical protein
MALPLAPLLVAQRIAPLIRWMAPVILLHAVREAMVRAASTREKKLADSFLLYSLGGTSGVALGAVAFSTHEGCSCKAMRVWALIIFWTPNVTLTSSQRPLQAANPVFLACGLEKSPCFPSHR